MFKEVTATEIMIIMICSIVIIFYLKILSLTQLIQLVFTGFCLSFFIVGLLALYGIYINKKEKMRLK